MSTIKFEAQLERVQTLRLIRIPEKYDLLLPSRGIVEIKGHIEKVPIHIVLEPDGLGGHWFEVDENLFTAIQGTEGNTFHFEIEPIKVQLEVQVPEDLNKALLQFDSLHLWHALTVQARWEWVRWIRSTSVTNTRNKRIETAMSMLKSGKKRPCCFDHSRCSRSDVSKNGVLQK